LLIKGLNVIPWAVGVVYRLGSVSLLFHEFWFYILKGGFMWIECPQCHFKRDIPEDKVPQKAVKATCPKCGHKFNFREQIQEHQDLSTEPGHQRQEDSAAISNTNDFTEEKDIWSELESLDSAPEEEKKDQPPDRSWINPEGKGKIPWEQLDEYGFFPGFFQTIKCIMFSPLLFFSSLNLDLGFQKPLIFYLLVAEIQAIAQLIWKMLGVVPQMQSQTEGLLGMGLFGFGSAFLLIMYPVVLTVILFVVSWINHLCLLAVKSGSFGYEATYRVVSYSSAPMVLAIIPVFGPFIGWLWSMVCTFIGFMSVHQTSPGRVILAMLLPFFAIILILTLIVMVIGIPH